MCGIAGILSSDSEKRHKIKLMTDTLFHRGPEEEGYFQDDNISLGQRRLKIIDLESGRQPISNEDNSIHLICNGEIYNSAELRKELISKGHRFKTHSDVEVILHLYEDYGYESIKKLRGMFAFALWDSNKKELLLARDHLGQKPLFFYKNGSSFLFASEIKAILAMGFVKPEIDLNGLNHYISLRYLPDQYTLFKNIQKLTAGSFLIYSGEKVSIKKYWNIDFTNKTVDSEKDITEQLDNLLRSTVKQHLMSDVPVGTFLSGGIDSGLITAMAADITQEPLSTFTIGVKDKEYNEIPFARSVARHYKLDGIEEIVEADLISMIPSMIWHMEEPSDPFGVGVYLASGLAQKHVKVVLGGDGGDENFAGYDRYAGNKMVDYYCLFPEWFRKFVVKSISEKIPDSFGYKGLSQKANWLNEMSFFTKGERYAHSMSYLRFTMESKQKLFTSEALKNINDYDSYDKILKFFDSPNVDDLIDRMLYTDLMTRVPDHLLALVDRMSMAHSIESRSPLMDYKVVEFAASIPAGMKLKGKNLKYLLKKVASRYLPEEIINRKKQGFGFPIAKWMQNDLSHLLRNLFKQSRFVENGIIDAGYINALLSEHLSGKKDHNFRLWILLNLEIWYRMYFENMSTDSAAEFIKQLNKEKSLAAV